MNIALRTTFVLACLALAGCVSTSVPPPTRADVAAADVGPMPEDYREQIAAALKIMLKDPESARVEYIGEPLKDYTTRLNDASVSFGWRVRVNVNAKNSYGGYTGWSEYQFFFRFGRLVMVQERYARDGFRVVWRR